MLLLRIYANFMTHNQPISVSCGSLLILGIHCYKQMGIQCPFYFIPFVEELELETC